MRGLPITLLLFGSDQLSTEIKFQVFKCVHKCIKQTGRFSIH
jgi:hypothetical protein